MNGTRTQGWSSLSAPKHTGSLGVKEEVLRPPLYTQVGSRQKTLRPGAGLPVPLLPAYSSFHLGGLPWRPQECLSQKPPRILRGKLCGTGMGGTPKRRQGEEGLPGSSISGEAAGGWLLEKSAGSLFAYQFAFGFQRNRHPHPGLPAPPPALTSQRLLLCSPPPNLRQKGWSLGWELWGRQTPSKHPPSGAGCQVTGLVCTSTSTQGRTHTSVTGVTAPSHGAAAGWVRAPGAGAVRPSGGIWLVRTSPHGTGGWGLTWLRSHDPKLPSGNC